MKVRMRMILHYLCKFILSIVFLLLVLLTTLRLTILSEKYMLKQFEKTGYFEKLSKTILDEMSNYIIQSGLDEEVLNNIYTTDMIEKDMHTIITSIYRNQDMNIDTTELKENLENNVAAYLEKNNIKVADQTSLDRFVDQIADVYQSKVSLSGNLNLVKGKLNKVITYVNIAVIALLITTILLSLFIKFYLKKEVFAIPFFTTAFLIFIGCYFFKNSININNIMILNKEISSFLTEILSKLLSRLNLIAIILMIIGIMETVILKIFKTKK